MTQVKAPNADEIKQQALLELENEERARLVDIEKARIIEERARKKYWFPWRIKLINLNREEVR